MEAKRLNEPLGTTERQMQMLTYANFSGVSFAGLTDGDKWVLYRVFDQRPLADRLVLDISLADSPAYESALKLLLLWHPNLASGVPIKASEPIMGTGIPVSASPKPERTSSQNVVVEPQTGWITLKEVNTKPGENRIRPPVIRFPNGEEKQITMWIDFLIGVAEWLVRDGSLTPGNTPIPDRTYPSVYIVNSQPVHAEGAEFSRRRELPNGLHLYTWGGAKEYVNRAITLLEACGKNSSTVHAKVG